MLGSRFLRTSCRAGLNAARVLGRSNTAAMSTGPPRSATSRIGIICGTAVVGFAGGCFLSDVYADEVAARLFAWGSDQYGQLGVGSGVDEQQPTEASSASPHAVIDVDAAGLSTGVLTSNGEFFTFGCGMHGRLGHGPSLLNLSTPRKVQGIPKPIAAISVGENHVAAVTVDGELYTAGRQIHGCLGHSNEDKARPARVLGALDGKQVVAVACGTKHSLALTAAGEVYAFGEGRTLALGQGDSKANADSPALVEALQGKHVVEVAAGNGFSVARTKDGEVYSWGSNDYGQLGQGITKRYNSVGKVVIDESVSAISCGDFHVVALADDGRKVYSFGCGGDGRTGLGNTENTAFPQQISGLATEKVVLVAAGGSHSMATTADNKIFTWGKGRNGQLGQGDQIASVAAYRTQPVEISSVGTPISIACGKDHSCMIVQDAEA